MSHCGLICISLKMSVEHFFHVFIGQFSVFGEMSVSVLCPFFELSLLLTSKSSLYISDESPL